MSRTFKDRPARVKLHYAPKSKKKVYHFHYKHENGRQVTTECDFDPDELAKTNHWQDRRRCGWVPISYRAGREFYSGRGAPKWWVDHISNNPRRRIERDELREALKEYNGSGDTDVDVPEKLPQSYWD